MSDENRMLAALIAPLFVVLWSTGFIGAKYGLPYAEPLTFLSIRFALASVALTIWAVAAGSPWPKLCLCAR
jgi:drug/metabolite transporter (DMT)-like permease